MTSQAIPARRRLAQIGETARLLERAGNNADKSLSGTSSKVKGTIVKPLVDTISSDANATFTVSKQNSLVFHTGTLTGNKTITISGGSNKYQIRFVRTGSGAFNLSINGLKNLSPNEWCDVFYTSGAWVLIGFGTL